MRGRGALTSAGPRKFPTEALKRPAMRIATAILMYSFGGLRREGANGNGNSAAWHHAGRAAVCLRRAGHGQQTVIACLKELKDNCLYLHFDGVRYCFKKDPNVTLLVEQEAEAVARDEGAVREKIKEMLEARLAGHQVEVWPANSGAVPDKQPFFLVAYLPLEFAGKSKTERQAAAQEIFENYGDKPRQFRNGLALAIPSRRPDRSYCAAPSAICWQLNG